MEIQFQQPKRAIPTGKAGGKFKRKSKSSTANKFVGVRQRPSGRWVAEIKDTTQKIRMWLGTFETAEEAARAYDEAACLLRGANTRTNFITQVSLDSPLASRIRNLLNSRKGVKQDEDDGSTRVPALQASDIANSPGNSISNSTSSSSCSSNENSHSSGAIIKGTQLLDDAYRPDLSHCSEELQCGTASKSHVSWGFGDVMDLPKNVDLPNTAGRMEFTEFERMKVERQISASLYAMNGVQECMAVQDCSEDFWDLQPLCPLFS